MLDAARALSETLRRENLALMALDLDEAAAMLGEKTAAVERFAAAARLPDGPLVDAETTRRTAHRLRGLADENRRLLNHAIDVQGRVVGTIRQAAMKPGTNRRYQRSGAQELGPVAPISMRADV
jgi:hypothetical protein